MVTIILRLNAQALEFYGPLRTLFIDKLKGNVLEHLKEALDHAFDFEVDDAAFEKIADLLKDANAECEFNKIVSYMTGEESVRCRCDDGAEPGRATSLALLYQGGNAVEKIRSILGSTNPDEAAEGTVRSGSSACFSTWSA